MALATSVMFSHLSDEYRTPRPFMRKLWKKYGGFAIDLAASGKNRIADEYLGPDHFREEQRDALAVDWASFAQRMVLKPLGYCNPPYSVLPAFIAKASEQQRRGFMTVMLIPARTDTAAWHDHVWDKDKQRPRPGIGLDFVRGRLSFFLDITDEMRQAVRRLESDAIRPKDAEERKALEKLISTATRLPVLVVRAILDNKPEALAGAPFPSVVVSFHPETR